MTRLRAALWSAAEWIAEIDPWVILLGYVVGMAIALVAMVRA